MKKYAYLFLTLLLLLSVFCIDASAEEAAEDSYTLRYDNGEYVLEPANTEEDETRDKSLDSLLSTLSCGRVFFDNVRVYEPIDVPMGEFVLSGNVFLEANARFLVRGGTHATFSDFCAQASVEGEVIEICEGEAVLENCSFSGSAESCISVTGGSLALYGENTFSGFRYGVSTDTALKLSDGENVFLSNEPLTVQYTVTPTVSDELLIGAKNLDFLVKCYDNLGQTIPLFKVKYVSGSGDVYIDYKLYGERAENISPTEIKGYTHSPWRDSTVGKEYDFSLPVTEDITLVSDVCLLAPDFKLSGGVWEYNAKSRSITPSEIYHPLLAEGSVKYEWYKDGSVVSEEPSLKLKDVSQSGKYTLRLTFIRDGERAYAEKTAEVNISPKPLYASFEDGRFYIDGSLVEAGDTVNIYQYEHDGYIYSNLDNFNYCLEFSPQMVKNDTADLTNIMIWVVICAGALLIAFMIFVFVYAKRICISSVEITPKSDDGFLNKTEERVSYSDAFAVSRERAEELLSDKLAKTMISTSDERIVTGGKERCEVSVGEICDAFCEGERVDVNAMKERGLVSEEVSYVKIVGRGSCAKSLSVYANAFEPSAVKMIVLSGGEVFKIKNGKI